jgi:endothelin-converting enzyme/putative endopeptidase
LTGAKQRPSDERALQVINGMEALEIICRKIPAEAKNKAEKMIKNIFIAFENRINNLLDVTRQSKCS